jgi:hypothetical protein
LFTDSFNFSEREEDKIKETMANFRENNEDIFNVVVVGMNMDKDSAQLLSRNLEFNKSCFLDFDNIGKLKNILKIMGTIKDDITFQNEKYEADKKGE